MASKIGMINAALQKIGVSHITSLTEDSEAQRKTVPRFDDWLNFLLGVTSWDFANARVQLAALTETPAFEWSYQFQLPTDCLFVREEYNGYEYKVEGRLLLCNSTPVQIKYTKEITDVNELSATFREAWAFWAASEIVIPLTGSASLKEKMDRGYGYALAVARARNAQQDHQKSYNDSDYDGDWITDRN